MPELADLLDADGLQKFATADQAFFLGAATDMIRHFCGWHIAPSKTETAQRIRVGERGLVLLPTLFVSAVAAVVVDGRTLTYPDDYEWDTTGVITRRVPNWPKDRTALVTYTHGYAAAPRDVAAIGYELVQQARSKPGANSKDVAAGPYRVSLLKLGVGLDDDQKRRLWDAGVVRAPIA